jgi:hypothetical protein
MEIEQGLKSLKKEKEVRLSFDPMRILSRSRVRGGTI